MGAEYYVTQVALSHFGKAVSLPTYRKSVRKLSLVSSGLFNELDVPKGMELPEGTDLGGAMTVSALGILL